MNVCKRFQQNCRSQTFPTSAVEIFIIEISATIRSCCQADNYLFNVLRKKIIFPLFVSLPKLKCRKFNTIHNPTLPGSFRDWKFDASPLVNGPQSEFLDCKVSTKFKSDNVITEKREILSFDWDTPENTRLRTLLVQLAANPRLELSSAKQYVCARHPLCTATHFDRLFKMSNVN